ncbi:MAG: hypothetical protein ACLUIQ_12155 [Dialister invisus]
MHITCEGKAYELFEGATPQNLWNMVSGGRDPEMAVLADCEGDIIDFQTPFTGDTDVKWIPLGSPLAHRAYQRSLIMLLAIAAKEVYGGKIEVTVKHALGKALYCEFSDGHVPLQKELDVLRYKMEEIVKFAKDEKGKEIPAGEYAVYSAENEVKDWQKLSKEEVSEIAK